MALIRCRECQSEVSNDAKTCPQCGCSNPDKTQHVIGVILTGILIVIGIVMLIAWTRK